MKKKIVILALLALLIPSVLFAAGTVTQRLDGIGRDMWKLTFTCTGDSSDGSFPATDISATNMAYLEGKYLVKVTTNPGTTAPTDNYDITITDANGVDIMGGTLANRDTSNSEEALPYIGGVAYGPTPIPGTLTLNITNNSVNSAGIVVELIFSR